MLLRLDIPYIERTDVSTTTSIFEQNKVPMFKTVIIKKDVMII